MLEAILKLARPTVRRMKAYSSARSLNLTGHVLLDANELPFSGSEGLNRYPQPQPQSMQQHLRELYRVDCEQMMMGRGSDDAIDALIRTFCESGQHDILVCPPTYGVYALYAELQGAGIVEVPLAPQSFEIDVDAILQAISPRVRCVFVCTPNNPTGNALSGDSLRRLLAATRERCIVVVDEAYIEFSETSSLINELKNYPQLVVLRTLSKAWGMAGARCGVALGHPEVIALLHKVRAPYPLSTPTQKAVCHAFDRMGNGIMEARVAAIRSERTRMAQALAEYSFVVRVFPSDANFLLLEVKKSRHIMDFCRQRGFILRERSRDFESGQFIRISIGTPDENRRLLYVLSDLEKLEKA